MVEFGNENVFNLTGFENIREDATRIKTRVIRITEDTYHQLELIRIWADNRRNLLMGMKLLAFRDFKSVQASSKLE